MNAFDPNLLGVPNGRYFALPFSQNEEAENCIGIRSLGRNYFLPRCTSHGLRKL